MWFIICLPSTKVVAVYQHGCPWKAEGTSVLQNEYKIVALLEDISRKKKEARWCLIVHKTKMKTITNSPNTVQGIP